MLNFFIVLLVCQLAGESIVVGLGLPLPGPVVGMLLLFCGLLVYGRTPVDLEKVCSGLLSNLSLLFVPAGVGIMLHLQLVKDELWPILISLVVSTLITLMVTGWLMQRLGREADQGE